MGDISIRIERVPKYISAYILKMNGSIDMKTAIKLEETCQNLCAQGDERLIMDFFDIEYINSQGLGVLMDLQKKLNELKGGIVVIALNERVNHVFQATGVNKAISIYPTLKEALAEDVLFKKG
jgi:anti-sigma B factor antagonist